MTLTEQQWKMAASAEPTLDSTVSAQVCQIFNIPSLTDYQSQALHAAVALKRDALICVPSLSDKSLCYEALTTVYQKQNAARAGGDCDTDTGTTANTVADPIVLVVSSLLSLDAQVKSARSHGFRAANISSISDSETQELREGKYSYIFGKPEHYQKKRMSKILRLPLYEERVIAAVFDEVPASIPWDVEAEENPGFESLSSTAAEMGALFTKAPTLGLAGIASKKNIARMKSLLFLRSPLVYVSSPDISNIRMHVQKVCPGIASLEWLRSKLVREKEMCPKTVIYCRALKDCGKLYSYFCEVLGNKRDPSKRLFSMVHSVSTDQTKDIVLASLKDPASKTRVVFATEIVGFGSDIPCGSIIHFGPPDNVETYLQQIGRASRFGQQAHSMMLYKSHQLREVETAMVKILLGKDGCIRDLAVSGFQTEDVAKPSPKHLCCSRCAKSCDCGNCAVALNDYEKAQSMDHDANSSDSSDSEKGDLNDITRYVSSCQRDDLENCLHKLKESLDKEVMLRQAGFSTPEHVHGLSEQALNEIIQKAEHIFTVDHITDYCHVQQLDTAFKVIDEFSNIFSDVEDFDDTADW